MDRFTLLPLVFALSTALVPVASFAAFGNSDDASDSELMGYDAIVKELNRETQTPKPGHSRAQLSQGPSRDPFDSIWIHGGVGFANMMQTLNLDNGQKLHLNQRGFQASLGIDLFSPNWMAEGVARSFTESSDASTQVNLKEFELKIFYKNRFARNFGFRAGAGLAARYMNIRQAGGLSMDYTTPSSVGTMGLDLFLSQGFSIGADLSARNTMIAETPDQTSYDATLRLDTHF